MASRNLIKSFAEARKNVKTRTIVVASPSTVSVTDYTSHFEKIDLIFTNINTEILVAEKLFAALLKDIFTTNNHGASLEKKFTEINSKFDEIRKLCNISITIASNQSEPHKTIITNMHKQKLKKFQQLLKKFNDIKLRYVDYLRADKKASTEFTSYFGEIPEMDMMGDQTQTQEDYDSHYMTERNEEISKLCESITELDQIYQDLAIMVVSQGEIIDRIDKSMDAVVDSTTKGVVELKKAEAEQKKCVIM